MITDILLDEVKRKSCVCLGLDTRPGYIPSFIGDQDLSTGEKIFEFNRRIVDATCDLVGCYKVQIACYEALGMDGMKAYADTLKYIRSKGSIVIADVKRGDISSTAEQYALGHFTGDFEADMITVNAYMGEDAVSPYYPFLEKNKGLFVLVKTSNKSGVDFQDLGMTEDGEPLYVKMARKVAEWGRPFTGQSGFSAIGAVTGLTYPEEFETIKEVMPHTFLLIPGYGAQGGTGRDIASFFRDGVCGVVNSSRGLITAHKGKTDGEDYTDYVRQAVLDMKQDIEQWL